MFKFEKLAVWKGAVAFADLIYRVTRRFPTEERYRLTSQMRRAAASVSSNISEGSARESRVDYARYLQIAKGSLYEVVSQATLAERQGLLGPGEFQLLYAEAGKQDRLLNLLRGQLLRQTRAKTAGRKEAKV